MIESHKIILYTTQPVILDLNDIEWKKVENKN